MTKHTPGSDYQYGQPPQHQNGQLQYGQADPPYGSTSSGNYSQQSNYGGDYQGAAQSYYGSNDRPYAEYPHDRPPPPENYYQGPPESSYPPQPQQYNQYGGPPPPQHYDQRQQYGSPQPGYSQPQYTQGYPAAPQQWDQQNAPHMPPQGQYGAPPGQYPPGPGQTGEERGLMGALAGGAAGAYGGHKMNHGVLGGIGGAVAGSMLEDAYKKKNKKDKKHKKPRRGSHSSSSSSSSSSSDSDSSKKKKKHGGGGRAMAGNFHASSRSVRIEGRSMLVADCADTRGHLRRATIELNDCFTNTNGQLLWARGGNFAASARGIRLTDNGKVLECELGDGRGGWKHNRIELDERLTNRDGQLRML